MTSKLTTLALTAAIVLVPSAGGVQAKSPPKGDYGCSYTTLSGTFGAGILNIKSKSKYSVNDQKKGKYKTKGRRINFKTGDYRTLYYGKWRKIKNVLSDGYSFQIKLYGKKDGEEKLTCSNSR